VARLTVLRSNLHIYASVISDDGQKVLASASTAEKECASSWARRGKGGNVAPPDHRQAHRREGEGLPASRRSRSTAAGFAYHGRVKALAEAAREAGLQF
jgi:large subunit ribosomal protein L18